MFDWNLKQEISTLAAIRERNGIHAGSKLRILAVIDEKVMVKIGTRYDVGSLVPSDFHPAAHGKDYCLWEKGGLRVPAGRHL
jgi:alpha-amylase